MTFIKDCQCHGLLTNVRCNCGCTECQNNRKCGLPTLAGMTLCKKCA